MAERCPFEEQDCLRARGLLFEAAQIVAALSLPTSTAVLVVQRVEAEYRAKLFLARPEISRLLALRDAMGKKDLAAMAEVLMGVKL